jgi:plastocyanin
MEHREPLIPRRRTPLALVAGALALMLVACPAEDPTEPDPPDPGPPEAEETRVEIAGNAFQPSEVTISAGTVVLWVNNDGFDHTITHGENGQPVDDPLIDTPIGPEQEQDLVFDEPGTYPITCTLHPQMNMTVIVEEE